MRVILLTWGNYTLALIVTTYSLPQYLFPRLLGKTDMGTTWGRKCQKSKRLFIHLVPYPLGGHSRSQHPIQILFLSCTCLRELLPVTGVPLGSLGWHWTCSWILLHRSPSGTECGHLFSSCLITKFFPPTVFLLLYTHHQLPSTTPGLVFIVSTIAGSSLNPSVLGRCTMYSVVKTYTVREASRRLSV